MLALPIIDTAVNSSPFSILSVHFHINLLMISNNYAKVNLWEALRRPRQSKGGWKLAETKKETSRNQLTYNGSDVARMLDGTLGNMFCSDFFLFASLALEFHHTSVTLKFPASPKSRRIFKGPQIFSNSN